MLTLVWALFLTGAILLGIGLYLAFAAVSDGDYFFMVPLMLGASIFLIGLLILVALIIVGEL